MVETRFLEFGRQIYLKSKSKFWAEERFELRRSGEKHKLI